MYPNNSYPNGPSSIKPSTAEAHEMAMRLCDEFQEDDIVEAINLIRTSVRENLKMRLDVAEKDHMALTEKIALIKSSLEKV